MVRFSIEFFVQWCSRRFRDTVSSVGFVPRHLPFTRLGTIAKTFRHALSLDERRARFIPDTFQPSQEWIKQQQRKRGKAWEKLIREQAFMDPNKTTDVLEVWFAGCHSGMSVLILVLIRDSFNQNMYRRRRRFRPL